MAMILEIVHPSGTRSWRRVESLPLTVGRGFANDVILDDPYADACHARIALDESGALTIEDLGSVNGIMINTARATGTIRLEPGFDVRLGRTTLRFRDPNEPVLPALVEAREIPVAPARPISAPARSERMLPGWMGTTEGHLIIGAAALFAVGLSAWFGTADRSGGVDAATGAMGFLGLAGLWAGAWAMASRATVQRFHYFAHFAVVSAVAIAALVWNTIGNWLDFFFPDAGMSEILGTVVLAVLLCALIAGHLSLSSTATRRRRWRIAGLVVAGALAAGGLVAVSMDDSFSDVATFSGMLKPIAARWIPTATVSEFGDVMKDLKKDVDDTVRDVPGEVEKTTKE